MQVRLHVQVVLYFQEYVYGPLPLLVFGVLALVAGFLNIVMPETHKTELPNTIEDAISLGRLVHAFYPHQQSTINIFPIDRLKLRMG